MSYSDTNNCMQALPSQRFVFYITGSVEHKHWGTKTNYSPVKWQQGWAQPASEKLQHIWLRVKVWPTQVYHSLEEHMNTETNSHTTYNDICKIDYIGKNRAECDQLF